MHIIQTIIVAYGIISIMNHSKYPQKRIVAMVGIIVVCVIAGFVISQNLQQLTRQKAKHSSQSVSLTDYTPKTYTNTAYGYSVQYPVPLEVNSQNSKQIDISSSCSKQTLLCINDTPPVVITADENSNMLTLDQYYNSHDLRPETCEKTSIAPLTDVYDAADEPIRAIRCDFKGGAGQASGYSYKIFRGDTIFDVSTFLNNGHFDSLGDDIVRTFKFTK